MRLYPVAKIFICKKMRQFMQQCNEECIFIQVAVNTDPVSMTAMGMPVIAQYGLPLPGNGKMHFMYMKIMQHPFKTPFGQIIL